MRSTAESMYVESVNQEYLKHNIGYPWFTTLRVRVHEHCNGRIVSEILFVCTQRHVLKKQPMKE
jgi:hypothetical protein